MCGKYILQVEQIENANHAESLDEIFVRIIKPNGGPPIPAESELTDFDEAKLGIGRYVVYGPKVITHPEPMSLDDAKKWLKDLNGKTGKSISKAVKYRVYLFD